MSSPLLAPCIGFKSEKNGEYVGYVREYQGLTKVLQVGEGNSLNPYARFHANPSTKYQGQQYYHLRSLYNNKYWVPKKQDNDWYIFLDANKPLEDMSSPSCTLFQIDHYGGTRCKISHAHNRDGYVLPSTKENREGCLLLGNSNNDIWFELTAMQTGLMLPKHVAFKGDNKQFLHVYWDNHPYLQFSTDDKHKLGAGNTIHTYADGTVRIWNKECKKYWRNSLGWIWPDRNDDTNVDTLFLPIKFGDMVALKSLLNNMYCKRLTADGKDNCLDACVETVTKEAQLLVEETIGSRKISNIDYHIDDSRVYEEEVVLFSRVTDINRGSTTSELEVPIQYSYKDQQSWTSTTTWKIGGSLTVSAGFPKVGVDAEVKIEASYEKSTAFGQASEQEVTQTYTKKVKVPPGKKVTVTILVTKGRCDVPFSYTQEDVLSDGTSTRESLDDGLFIGANHFNVREEHKEEDA